MLWILQGVKYLRNLDLILLLLWIRFAWRSICVIHFIEQRFPWYFNLVLVKPFDQPCLVGFEVNLARESSNTQLLYDMEQVNFFMQFVLSLLEKHILEIPLFFTACTTAAEKGWQELLCVENEIGPLFKVLNQKLLCWKIVVLWLWRLLFFNRVKFLNHTPVSVCIYKESDNNTRKCRQASKDTSNTC